MSAGEDVDSVPCIARLEYCEPMHLLYEPEPYGCQTGRFIFNISTKAKQRQATRTCSTATADNTDTDRRLLLCVDAPAVGTPPLCKNHQAIYIIVTRRTQEPSHQSYPHGRIKRIITSSGLQPRYGTSKCHPRRSTGDKYRPRLRQVCIMSHTALCLLSEAVWHISKTMMNISAKMKQRKALSKRNAKTEAKNGAKDLEQQKQAAISMKSLRGMKEQKVKVDPESIGRR